MSQEAKRFTFFQLFTLFVLFLFFSIMAVVAVTAYSRRSGFTGMNMAKVQQIRLEAAANKQDVAEGD